MRRWFLPDTPALLPLLREQAAVTEEGLALFREWAHGGEVTSDAVDELEHAADELKRRLRDTLREAFTTEMAPEDVFALSHGLDEVLNGAKNTVREAEAMAMAPPNGVAGMADLLHEGVGHLRAAFEGLGRDTGAATAAADAAIKSQRRLEREYRAAMAEAVSLADVREVAGRRELYRRLSRASDALTSVADRVWYAVVKEA